MIDRLGRKPLSEGYDLWDKGYPLGALRLFQCKLELAPPFEVAVCLDCVAELLHMMEEPEESLEHYTQARDKYEMIGRKLLAGLMSAKEVEAKEGPQAALDVLAKLLAPFDARRSQGLTGADFLGEEGKGQGSATTIGRCYLYRAELMGGMDRTEDALREVETSVAEGADRLHLAHATRADLLCALSRTPEAIGAYESAIAARGYHVESYESLARCLRAEGKEAEAIDVIDRCMKLHPKATLLRDKAFILSNLQRDEEALNMLDKQLEQPPHEETETLTTSCESEATLFKAKAAILADAGRFEEANRALEGALGCVPDDEEAESMRREVYVTLGRDYLAEKEIPQYLDALVAMVLESKPQNPITFMIDAVDKDAVAVAPGGMGVDPRV